MKRFKIRILVGDRVTIGVSPYDPSHGLITHRQKVNELMKIFRPKAGRNQFKCCHCRLTSSQEDGDWFDWEQK